LNFNILGGSDTLANNGIFVSKVEKNSKAYEAGLRRGDQVIYLIRLKYFRNVFFLIDSQCKWSMF
jgi:predicted metalloprotease with PDZ domain